jgi:NADH dehydrogenase
MILVTGGTGFIGKALIPQLVGAGFSVRTLIRPSQKSPDLPRGVPVEVAVSSITDERGLRSAMVGIDTVYHLAGGEWKGAHADLLEIDIQGTQTICQVAADAGVARIFYVSHLGADRASAFPVLKAKAIAEEYIRRSELTYTILRTAIVYGPGDSFTTGLARLVSSIPYFFFIPDDGQVMLQPFWVEDLVTCLIWSLDIDSTIDQTISVGGPEYLSFNQVVDLVMEAINVNRTPVHVYPPYLRALTVILESLLPGLPTSVYWLDYFAVNRTCALDTVPRVFNLMPGRFSHNLDHLRDQEWRTSLFRSLFRRK